jgi:hypothetical protein
LETNPLFPSGEWEGFYTYEFGPDARRYMMSFALTFKNGKVSGSGIDNVSRFSWRGNYDTEKLRCWMQKRYPSHTVSYDGYVDQKGIWGFGKSHPIAEAVFIFGRKDSRKILRSRIKRQFQKLSLSLKY